MLIKFDFDAFYEYYSFSGFLADVIEFEKYNDIKPFVEKDIKRFELEEYLDNVVLLGASLFSELYKEKPNMDTWAEVVKDYLALSPEKVYFVEVFDIDDFLKGVRINIVKEVKCLNKTKKEVKSLLVEGKNVVFSKNWNLEEKDFN